MVALDVRAYSSELEKGRPFVMIEEIECANAFIGCWAVETNYRDEGRARQ